MKIAYQGIPGSNSEAVSVIFAQNQGFIAPEYVPAVHSRGVIEMLRSGQADYGVMATRNLMAGTVGESDNALSALSHRVIDAQWLSIHHCLFAKSADSRFDTIASHIQALGQCRNKLHNRYPECLLREMEDTALAARMLADGTDDSRNMTEFVLIKAMHLISKTVIVAGLGLIGGSMAKAIKKNTDCRVLGWNRTRATAEKALADGAIDAIAEDADFESCDMLIVGMYPAATEAFLLEKIPKMKRGALAVDLAGVKTRIVESAGMLAREYGVRFTGGHPMQGLAHAGYERSFADLYKGASMILVPSAATLPGDVDELGSFFRSVGFGRITVAGAEVQDHMIAHTSQLAHIVSNSYVKSPVSTNYAGFSGGSYKDMTRIACLDERVWKELFIWNKNALLPEIDDLVHNIMELRDAIEREDYDRLERLLRAGREAKERIDAANPDQPSD